MEAMSRASNRPAQSNSKRYACYAAVAIAVLFMWTLSSSTVGSHDEFSRQAQHPNHHASGGEEHPINDDDFDQLLMDEITKTEGKMEKIVHDFLLDEKDGMCAAITERVEKTRKYIERALKKDGHGLEIAEEEMDRLMNQIEDRLATEVAVDLTQRAQDLLERVEQELEIDADLEEEDLERGGEQGEEDVPFEIKEEEERLLQDVVDGIQKITDHMKKELKGRVALIAKELLEVLLKRETGSTYIVVIEHDQVSGFEIQEEGDDDLDDDTTSLEDDKFDDDDAAVVVSRRLRGWAGNVMPHRPL